MRNFWTILPSCWTTRRKKLRNFWHENVSGRHRLNQSVRDDSTNKKTPRYSRWLRAILVIRWMIRPKCCQRLSRLPQHSTFLIQGSRERSCKNCRSMKFTIRWTKIWNAKTIWTLKRAALHFLQKVPILTNRELFKESCLRDTLTATRGTSPYTTLTSKPTMMTFMTSRNSKLAKVKFSGTILNQFAKKAFKTVLVELSPIIIVENRAGTKASVEAHPREKSR